MGVGSLNRVLETNVSRTCDRRCVSPPKFTGLFGRIHGLVRIGSRLQVNTPHALHLVNPMSY